ncbi:hypothetical protein JKF63_05076 [Porcisia hertigi]|uniref:DNA mismatch repair proteins mutS family domain-containing protein n=1 Tax=Porcisia hertigi TaxID=2761500 RepID=A0A836IJD5_9TRYP|nr:hypothetical protein JKF63_05076 [Porcisia hertigi]
MFASPTAWYELYGPPPPPSEVASQRHRRASTAATPADRRRGVGQSPPGYVYTNPVLPPAHLPLAASTTSALLPSVPSALWSVEPASSHYTVASQPVRCFPPPPAPALFTENTLSYVYAPAHREGVNGWAHPCWRTSGEGSHVPVQSVEAAVQWPHGTCGSPRRMPTHAWVSGSVDPGAAGGVFAPGVAAADPYAMHEAYPAGMATETQVEAWKGDASQYSRGVSRTNPTLYRPPPPTQDGPLTSGCRGATPRGVVRPTSLPECEEAARVTAEEAKEVFEAHRGVYASRAGCQVAADYVEDAVNSQHRVDRPYPDEQLHARSLPLSRLRPPLPQRSEQEGQLQPHEYSSISEGARHLNSARHRSAASAAALFFHSPSGMDGSGASPCAGGAAALRQGRRVSTAGAPAVSTSTVASASPTGASAFASTAASAAAAQAEPCCVAALIFNNAKEVGVALCELPSLAVSLFQYGDTATFFKTASLLHTRNPVEVLVPSTAVDSELVQTLLRQHGAHMTFTSVQRCFYNSEDGVQRLLQLKSSAEALLCIEDTDRYLCVAAANAVVLYMEHVNDMHLLPGSVRVRAEVLEHYMEVSRTTARALQVIPDVTCVPAATAAAAASSSSSSMAPEDRHPRQEVCSQHHGAAQSPSFLGGSLPEFPPLQTVALVDAIPRACTIMGQRYLRRTLLQPLRDRVAVQGRHDAVEWLLCEPRRLHMLRTLLRHTAALDLERLTATLTHQPRCERTSAQQQSFLESLQLLWSALPYLEHLHVQLRGYLGPLSTPPESGHDESQASLNELHSTAAHPSVLHSIAAALEQCRFPELETLMGTYLERSVLPSVVEHHEQSTAHHGALHGVNTGGTYAPPSVFVQAPLQRQRQLRRRRLRSDDGAGLNSRQQPQKHSQRVTDVLLRLLRMCFLVRAPRGGELDALRTRLSLRISDITSYAAELRAAYQIFSLRLEPDAVKLYCFSYVVAEDAKARAAPFTWRYAGGSHFALCLSTLREQQLLHPPPHQRKQGQHLRTLHRHSPTCVGDSLYTAPSFHSSKLSRQASDADDDVMHSPVVDASAFPTPGADPTSCRQLRRRRVRCSTEDLDYRCARAQECVAAILQLQLRSVQPLVSAIRHDFLNSLQATVESVALLDTLLSFALYSLTHHCTRPVLIELRTGSTTAPHLPTATTEPIREGEAVASSERNASAPASDSRVPWDKVLQDIDGAGVAAGVGCLRGGAVGSLERSGTSSDAASPSSTPSLSTLMTCTTASAAATMESETRHASRPSLFIENALHPSATQWQSPNRTVMRAGLSARLRGAEGMGVPTPTSVPHGGLTMSWGSDGGAVCVVTGPNTCGKTTLLRILGQYFTLAQAGCFVPAQRVQLFLADRLLAHMLCDELPSIMYSSFRRELMELGELTHAATAESVVFIDELGRSTTTTQGFSLAWATALLLSDRHVHSVLTTHYAGLPSLARVRPARVVAFHFRVVFEQLAVRDGGGDGAPATSSKESSRPRITIARFCHTLFPGPCPQRWYGLALAEKMQFFEPVLALARRTQTHTHTNVAVTTK